MTPDEYERNLRRAIYTAISDDMADSLTPALDAYAEWLRLRERAEYGCRPEYHDGSLVIDKPCPGHQAQQQIAAILAAAVTITYLNYTRSGGDGKIFER